MSLRAALPSDLPALVEVEQECFEQDRWSESAVNAELLGVPRTRYVVVVDSDVGIEGYASLLVVADTADVQRIAVRPRARRCGFGHAMLRRLLAQAVERGCVEVFLEVRADNAAARALYDDFGFEETDRRTGYYRDGTDAFVLRTSIGRTGG